MAKRGKGAAVGITFRPRIGAGLPVGAVVKCADNSGAYLIKIISVIGYRGRLHRLPAASVGDMVRAAVKSGVPEMKHQIVNAIIVRQRRPYRRPDGSWVQFEDNAAVIISPEGDPKGTEVRGPVAEEAARRWPKIAGLSTMII